MSGKKVSFTWNGIQIDAIVGPPGLVGDTQVTNGHYKEPGDILALTASTSDGYVITDWLTGEAMERIEEQLLHEQGFHSWMR